MTNVPCTTILWLVASSLILGNGVQGQINATAIPTVTEVEIDLNCGNEGVSQFSGFPVSVGGKEPTAVSTSSMVPVQDDSLDRPVCGGVTPGGKGYWFPVETSTYGEVDLLFCTATETPLLMTATVYQAPLVSEFEITNCEDLSCVAIGTKHPVQSEEQVRFYQGNICPNATNSGGVHFTASKGQLYFVHVDFTTNLTDLSGFEAISYVMASSGSSVSWYPSVWTVATLLLIGWTIQ